MDIPKQPISPSIVIPQPDVIYDGISIELQSCILGELAIFRVNLFNGTKLSGGRLLTMKGDDYNAWGSDDSYVYSWAITQLTPSNQ